VKVRDGQGVHLIQIKAKLRSVVREGRASRAKTDVKQHGAQVSFEQIGHSSVAHEPVIGFPFHQHCQLQAIKLRQVEGLSLTYALLVKFCGPGAALLEAAVFYEQPGNDNWGSYGQHGPPYG
jgi:hypothetical protein